jgi:signal transduction histidine kinase
LLDRHTRGVVTVDAPRQPEEPRTAGAVARRWSPPSHPRSFLDLVTLPYVVPREVQAARARRRLELKAARAESGRAPLERPLEEVIDLHHHATMERLLGAVRLVAVAALFFALSWSTGLLHPYAGKVLMGLYAAYSASLYVFSWLRPHGLGARRGFVHVTDLLWATAVTTISGGTSSHVFPLFLFVLAASAYRWGLWRTLLDAALITLVAVGQAALALAGLTPWAFELDWFVLWIGCTFGLAALLGMLSERQLALTFNAAAAGRVMTRVAQASGLRLAVQAALAEIAQVFGARRALFVAEEAETRRLSCWIVNREGGSLTAAEPQPLAEAERQPLLFPLPDEVSSFELRRQTSEAAPAVSLVLDAEGRRVSGASLPAQALDSTGPWDSAIGAVIGSTVGWSGRLYVLDPTALPATRLRLGLLQNLVRDVTPVITNLYLLRGLRERIARRERARIARELHDDAIQSLAGMAMRAAVLSRRAEELAPALAEEAAALSAVLQEEATRTREFMDQLRPVEIDAARLPTVLRELAERFSRNTGLDARLQWNLHALYLTPAQSAEVFRMVQEALVNVRRHSSATRVVVRVTADADGWTLTIADNGQGMGFSGRLNHEALKRAGRGPAVIRDRVEALGGTLTVDSQPTGATLEITVPHELG